MIGVRDHFVNESHGSASVLVSLISGTLNQSVNIHYETMDLLSDNSATSRAHQKLKDIMLFYYQFYDRVPMSDLIICRWC